MVVEESCYLSGRVSVDFRLHLMWDLVSEFCHRCKYEVTVVHLDQKGTNISSFILLKSV